MSEVPLYEPCTLTRQSAEGRHVKGDRAVVWFGKDSTAMYIYIYIYILYIYIYMYMYAP